MDLIIWVFRGGLVKLGQKHTIAIDWEGFLDVVIESASDVGDLHCGLRVVGVLFPDKESIFPIFRSMLPKIFTSTTKYRVDSKYHLVFCLLYTGDHTRLSSPASINWWCRSRRLRR